jgi:hypothetical protein
MARVPPSCRTTCGLPTQRWLFYRALDRGRTRSLAIWRRYAEALYDWLQTCQGNSWDWNDVEEGHVRAYRNRMLYHLSSLGRPYSVRTHNGRPRRLNMFCSRAVRRGLIDEYPLIITRCGHRSALTPNCLATCIRVTHSLRLT